MTSPDDAHFRNAPAADAESADELRRARRAWIAEHHPDRGGDPKAFAEGLTRFGAAHGSAVRGGAHQGRPAVYRSRSPVRRLHRLLRQLKRRAGGQPPRNLQ